MGITFVTKKELFDDARAIREEVFVKEQGFVEEIDETDGKAVRVVCVMIRNIRLQWADILKMTRKESIT